MTTKLKRGQRVRVVKMREGSAGDEYVGRVGTIVVVDDLTVDLSFPGERLVRWFYHDEVEVIDDH